MLKAAGKFANAEKLLLQGLDRVPEIDAKGRAVRSSMHGHDCNWLTRSYLGPCY